MFTVQREISCVPVSAYDTQIALFALFMSDDEGAHPPHSPELRASSSKSPILLLADDSDESDELIPIKKNLGACSVSEGRS